MPQVRRYLSASDGVAAALVAVMLMAVITLFAFFMNVGAMLLTRSRLETMTELGAAGGGRVVAEKIAGLAGQNVTEMPSDDDKKHPEKFLTEENRQYVQSDAELIGQVKDGVREYIGKNKPAALSSFDELDEASVAVTYPYPEGAVLNCANGKQTLDVHVAVNYDYPFMLGRISEWATGQSGITLSTTGIYSVQACP